MRKVEAEAARARCATALGGPWNAPWGTWEDKQHEFTLAARIDLPAALDMLERAMPFVEALARFPCAHIEYILTGIRGCQCLACRAGELLREWEAKDEKAG